MKSLWEADNCLARRASLSGVKKADVVVVGGGLAGILTAFLLSEQGSRVIVLEAGRIGGGQTKNTTAKITLQHDLIYDTLISKYGILKAAGYAEANEQGVKKYRQIIEKYQIACDFEIKDSWLYSRGRQTRLEKEYKAMERLQIQADYKAPDQLPFLTAAGICVPGQAQFHPLKFLRFISEKLEIYEKSKVITVEEGRVRTKEGSVEAEHIVIASHYPFVNIPGYYFLRLHQERSYIIAVKNETKLNGMYLGIDRGGYSLRNAGDYILVGGMGHRTGKLVKYQPYHQLRAAAGHWYPESEVSYQWSAQDCLPVGKVPYIGEYSKKMSKVYVMTGFQKWGMSSSMAAAQIVADKVAGRYAVYEEVFSPHRKYLAASFPKAVVNGSYTAKSYLKRMMVRSDDTIADMKNNSVKIVKHKGKKIGIYKDKAGNIHAVSIICPHLGCALSWNQEELSWDCPCHGSRFSYKGKLLDNPSLRRLSYEEKLF